ncbi:MAG: CPBP family intramembrane glutamic endopeptidase [Bacilli bacterium]|jgi:membrane protease YdiL (CAAX protease family)|nr:CPBP family intramembrane glutamic endopeptidase [Bacilli bacterium]NLN80553.1 CPBP family intramembrane metalloprotease [Erysipelotrichia bacterium]
MKKNKKINEQINIEDLLVECDYCRSFYESHLEKCPICQKENPHRPNKNELFPFLNIVWWKQLATFLIGWLGLYGISIILSLIFYAYASSIYSDSESVRQFLNLAKVNVLFNFINYVILFVGIAFLLFKDIVKVLFSFKKLRALQKGLIYGSILIIATIAYGLIITKLGIKIEDNVNEEAVVGLMTSEPILAFFTFVLLGPIVEELTYRLGLFSLLGRYKKWLAYLVTVLLFGLIHASFFSDNANLINELINLPSYLIAGFILTYAYDKEGFAASTYAHIFNNLVGFLFSLLATFNS